MRIMRKSFPSVMFIMVLAVTRCCRKLGIKQLVSKHQRELEVLLVVVFQCNWQWSGDVHVFHSCLLHQVNPNANGCHMANHRGFIDIWQLKRL